MNKNAQNKNQTWNKTKFLSLSQLVCVCVHNNNETKKKPPDSET